ncbi:LysR family substrate-binding domain-containing protein [Saccharothrix sp.]|uniref:LysR family substrate-binding domain-containing protein n=1 Tax=Saccharothrix sp. TaxID=1873460 RepID=UPI00281113C6|nr:LysR family substrate-binding domain-containing protein [Saccharothrix sp.]
MAEQADPAAGGGPAAHPVRADQPRGPADRRRRRAAARRPARHRGLAGRATHRARCRVGPAHRVRGDRRGTADHQGAEFSARHPEVVVEPKRFDWGGEVDALRDGVVDTAFVWLPADTSGLRTEVVALEHRLVGVAATHPLAARSAVTIADLRDEPLVWTRKAPRHWVDWWAVNPRPDGSEPVWGPENDNVEEMLDHVAAGAAVCIGPASMAAYYARPDLAWRPITDIPPLRIALARPVTCTNPLVTAFTEVVRELAGT